MDDDELLALEKQAERLQPQLKRDGPAPKIAHIMAAILIARDGYGARAACRAVPGVPENVHGRVNKLSKRVRALLDIDSPTLSISAPPQHPNPPQHPTPPPRLQQVLDDVGLQFMSMGTDVDALMHDLGLPPLRPVPAKPPPRTPPSEVCLLYTSPSPRDS